ncbi:M48 family metalloprotease [Nocardiopsis baichengensis]|uniref:M48 family metalloprotease n=1 Tax=Nocardiopsis baichengensis TaxID=280240 RepID=UPI00036F7674|nr:M48 family metalloprotease [Nocardiopsis baichengensis]
MLQRARPVWPMLGSWLVVATVSAAYAALCCAALWAVGLAWWWGLVPIGIALAGAELSLLTRVSGGTAPGDTIVIEPDDDPRLHAVVDRLCALTGQAKPVLRLYDARTPNAISFEPDTVYVSMGLLDRLDARELEGVIAHELAHLAHKDERVLRFASLMATLEWALVVPATVFALVVPLDRPLYRLASRCGKEWSPMFEKRRPADPLSVLAGARDPEHDVGPPFRPRTARAVLVLIVLARAALVIGCLAVVLPALFAGVLLYGAAWLPGRIAVLQLTRRRELAADRAAAVLTGAPSTLAATLTRLSRSIPASADLRSFANTPTQTFLPLQRVRRGKPKHPDDAIGRKMEDIWTTLRSSHPPVRVRVTHLERIAARMSRNKHP